MHRNMAGKSVTGKNAIRRDIICDIICVCCKHKEIVFVDHQGRAVRSESEFCAEPAGGCLSDGASLFGVRA